MIRLNILGGEPNRLQPIHASFTLGVLFSLLILGERRDSLDRVACIASDGIGLVYKAGALRRCRRFGIGLHFYTCVSSLLAL